MNNYSYQCYRGRSITICLVPKRARSSSAIRYMYFALTSLNTLCPYLQLEAPILDLRHVVSVVCTCGHDPVADGLQPPGDRDHQLHHLQQQEKCTHVDTCILYTNIFACPLVTVPASPMVSVPACTPFGHFTCLLFGHFGLVAWCPPERVTSGCLVST